MRMERGLDTGPVYASAKVDINNDDTTASLTPRLADMAGTLLDLHLSALLEGTLTPTPQPSGGTCTRPMTKDDGWIDWRLSAIEIERHVRAMGSWPRAWTTLPDGERVQVHRSHVIEGRSGEPGSVTEDDGSLVISCGRSSIGLDTVQVPGGKPVPGVSLLARRVLVPGDVLGTGQTPAPVVPLVVDC